MTRGNLTATVHLYDCAHTFGMSLTLPACESHSETFKGTPSFLPQIQTFHFKQNPALKELLHHRFSHRSSHRCTASSKFQRCALGNGSWNNMACAQHVVYHVVCWAHNSRVPIVGSKAIGSESTRVRHTRMHNKESSRRRSHSAQTVRPRADCLLHHLFSKWHSSL